MRPPIGPRLVLVCRCAGRASNPVGARPQPPQFGGDIEWNFAKFLVNRKGDVVGRIKASTDPSKPEVIAAIEKALDEPKP